MRTSGPAPQAPGPPAQESKSRGSSNSPFDVDNQLRWWACNAHAAAGANSDTIQRSHVAARMTGLPKWLIVQSARYHFLPVAICTIAMQRKRNEPWHTTADIKWIVAFIEYDPQNLEMV